MGARPAWVQQGKRVSKLAIDAALLRQTIIPTASHLCRIELLFAPYPAAQAPAIRLALWDPMQPQTPLAEQIVYAKEIQANAPYAFVFPPQPFSSGRTYQLTIAVHQGEGIFAHALWRDWTTPTVAATPLQRGDEAVRGALVYQLGYATATTPASTNTPLHDQAWATPPVQLHEMAWRSGQATVDEAGRLVQKTVQVVRRNGIMGLAEEIWDYVRWQFQ
jgi:hypothetical protein